MKILHVDSEKEYGGGEVQVTELVRYLADRGHGVEAACHPRGTLRHALEKMGVVVHPLRVGNHGDILAALHLRFLLGRGGFDIVHFHTARAHALCLGLKSTGPIRVVTRRMDYPVRRGWYSRYLYCRGVDGIVAISHEVEKSLVRAGIPGERIRVIHSGVDPEIFAPPAPLRWDGHPREWTIGVVASLEKRKGHGCVLDAVRLLKDEGWKLRCVVCGTGSLRRHLEKRTRELGLSAEVTFAGFRTDVPRLLSQWDLFVLPSLAEGLGVAIIEAMAAGLPVVASRVGGIPELVEEGKTGLLFPPGDAHALAECIRELAGHPEGARAMGDQGRKRVRERFTAHHMGEANEAYYWSLLRQRGRA